RPPAPPRGPGPRRGPRPHGGAPAPPLPVRRRPRRRPPHPEPTWAITGGGAVSPLIASAHDQTTPHLPRLHRGGRGLGPGRRTVGGPPLRAPGDPRRVHPEGRRRGRARRHGPHRARHLQGERQHHRPDVTLRGSGAGRTVLVPGTGKDACAEAGNGICVTGTDKEPLKDVSVRALTLRGYEKNGLWATRTEKLEVRDVTSEKNG